MTIDTLMASSTFVLGACYGSFFNVCNYRIPADLSIVSPSSFCPNCKTPIPFYLNVPILGWLFALGRCKTCRKPISPHYPLVEAMMGALFLALFVLTGQAWGACILGAVIGLLLSCILTDLKAFFMPGQLLYATIALVFAGALLTPETFAPKVLPYARPWIYPALAGGLCFWGLLYAIKKLGQWFFSIRNKVTKTDFQFSAAGMSNKTGEEEEAITWEDLQFFSSISF